MDKTQTSRGDAEEPNKNSPAVILFCPTATDARGSISLEDVAFDLLAIARFDEESGRTISDTDR